MSKTCIACGMPMTATDDFALGDVTKNYCRHCARPDGTMRSYDEALAGLSSFAMRTQGLDAEAARQLAIQMMATLPAWQSKSG